MHKCIYAAVQKSKADSVNIEKRRISINDINEYVETYHCGIN